MAKPTKKTEPSIAEIAATADIYESRRKITWPEYAQYRAKIAEFVKGRDAKPGTPGYHTKGLRWLIKTGMSTLNEQRKELGLDEIPFDISENSVLRYIDKAHPDEAKHFHR
jgi:hypothetical protein